MRAAGTGCSMQAHRGRCSQWHAQLLSALPPRAVQQSTSLTWASGENCTCTSCLQEERNTMSVTQVGISHGFS